MNKKVFVIAVILAIISLIVLFTIFHSSTQDFDGHFTMEIPSGTHYSDVAWCWANGALGCKGEYWDDDSDCVIGEKDIVVYYYNNSLLGDGESNAFEHAVNGLNTSYLFKIYQYDGDLIILTNDLGMRRVPTFLVGKSSETGDEAVFVGGRDLDYVKHYADTIEFLN